MVFRRVAGWYQDPDDPTRVRYWTGKGWTTRRRPRPIWHLVPFDLEADESWANPGGVSGTLVADATGVETRIDRLNLDRPFPLAPIDEPPFDDEPAFHSEPYPAERYRGSGRAERLGSSNFATPAGPWATRPRVGGPRLVGPGQPGWPGLAAGAGFPSSRWRQSRVVLGVLLGITVFAVLALLVNLGTTARDRFSAVSVDSTFVADANSACTQALGTPRVLISGTGASDAAGGSGSSGKGSAAGDSASSRPVAIGSPAATPSSSSGAVGSGGTASGGSSGSSPSPDSVTRLAATLRRLPLTPAAGPQVDAWLAGWQRYAADERSETTAQADHRRGAAAADDGAARAAATDADSFAVANGLGACTLSSSLDHGLEPIP